MKSTTIQRFSLLVFLLIVAAACQTAEPATTQPVAPGGSQDAAAGATELVIEGRLLPNAIVDLAFAVPGTVREVLAAEGAQVATGQLLATLGDGEQAAAAVKAAELELLAAQQALQALTDSQDALLNEAFLALIAARQAVDDAQRALDAMSGDRLQNDIAAAEAQLVLAEEQLNDAQEAFDELSDEEETDPARAAARLRLAEAQRAYDDVARLLDDLEGNGYAFVLQQAEDALSGALARRDLAAAHYEERAAGPDAAAQAAAEARIAAAQAGLTAAEAAVAQFELRAPIAGTLAASTLQVGAKVVAGQPVARLADLSAWVVETIDLTEIDVVAVEVGRTVQIVADALPDVVLTGAVAEIADAFGEVRGDVTYTARIRLDDVDPRLRWGMTVLVTFE